MTKSSKYPSLPSLLILFLLLTFACKPINDSHLDKITPTLKNTLIPTKTPTPTPTPTPIPNILHIEADGSGDFATLQEALEFVPEGGTIILSSGTFMLEKPVDVNISIDITGSGQEDSIIDSSAAGYVFRFIGDQSVVLNDLSIDHHGDKDADIIMVEGGEISILRCVIRHGNEAALRIRGNTVGRIQNSWFRNSMIGILIEDQAQPVIDSNQIMFNSSGIVYKDEASGEAINNRLAENHQSSIEVNNHAVPMLRNNEIGSYLNNFDGQFGIRYQDFSGGMASGNICLGQNMFEIFVADSAEPEFENNDCYIFPSTKK